MTIVSVEDYRDWKPIAGAPKDGMLLLLAVVEDEHHIDDAELARTIGFNNLWHDGEDKWFMAGWCWSHDHFTEGTGKPVFWRHLPAVPDVKTVD